MDILYLTAYSYPENAASSYLSDNRNEAFVNAGFGVVNYTPVPTRGVDDSVRRKYSKELKDEYLFDGKVIVHRFALMREGKNPLLRAIRYFLSCVIQFCKGVWGKDSRKCNVILVGSTPPIQGLMASFVKKIRKIPFVYIVQDIFPDSLAGTGLAKKGGLLWKIGLCVANFTFRNADKIIVISEDFKKNLMAKGVPDEKIEIIYNWVDEQAVVDVPRSENKLFKKYNLDPTKFYVTYNGNIGLTQNMDMLLEVAKEMEIIEDIQFVLVGNGAYLEQVKQIVADRNISNVHLLPFQPYEDISHVFSLGDVSLVISKPGVGENSVPSKTWSIMSASRPVLANFDENELKTIIEENNCGIFTKAGDKVAFTDAILKLYNDRDLCKEYGRNGRQFVMDNLTREVGTQKYVDVIKIVASSQR